jgi:chromosomal replication initiation ATPase DnaA
MLAIDVIFDAACIATGSDPRDIRGARRTRLLVDKRRFIAAKMRAEGYSLPEIGRALGGRHHTTVMNLLGLFERMPPRRAASCPGIDHMCKDCA